MSKSCGAICTTEYDIKERKENMKYRVTYKFKSDNKIWDNLMVESDENISDEQFIDEFIKNATYIENNLYIDIFTLYI